MATRAPESVLGENSRGLLLAGAAFPASLPRGAFPPIPRSARDERRRRRLPDSRAVGATRIPARSSSAIAGLPQHGRRALDGPLARREEASGRWHRCLGGRAERGGGGTHSGVLACHGLGTRKGGGRGLSQVPCGATYRAGTLTYLHAAQEHMPRMLGEGETEQGKEEQRDAKRTIRERKGRVSQRIPPPPSNEPTKQTDKRTDRQTPNENKALGRTRDGGGGGGAGGLREPAPRSPTRKPSPSPEPRVRGRGRREGASENNLAERGRRKALNND